MFRRGVAVCALIAAACSDSTRPPRPGALVPDGPTALNGMVGDPSPPLRVRVMSDGDRPLSNIVVSCAILAGGGSLGAAQATSDSDGFASCGPWTFGTQPGSGVAVVSHPGLDTVRYTATISAGAPASVVLERGLPPTLPSGRPIVPQPIALLQDRFGNVVTTPHVLITARSPTTGVTLSGTQVATDATGRARFAQLCVAGPSGASTLSFEAAGVPPTQVSADIEPEPAGGTFMLEFGNQDSKVIVVDTGVRVFFPPATLRDAAGLALCGDNTSLTVRSPSLLALEPGASALARGAGRTFVIAQSAQHPSAVDSVLVHVTQSLNGPLVRTDLAAFTLGAGTDYDVRILVDPRGAGAIAGVTLDVNYPRSLPGLLSLQGSSGPTGTTINASAFTGLVRITFISAAGVTGETEIAVLRFRALSAVPNFSQIVLVPLQVINASLQDVTGITTAVNPPFVVTQ